MKKSSKMLVLRLTAMELRQAKRKAKIRCNGNMSEFVRIALSEARAQPEVLSDDVIHGGRADDGVHGQGSDGDED